MAEELRFRFLRHVAGYIHVRPDSLIDQLQEEPVSRLFEKPEEMGISGDSLHRLDELKETLDLYKVFVEKKNEKVICNSPQAVADLLHEQLRYETREQVYVLSLNAKLELLSLNQVAIGSADSALVHPRNIFRPAILANAVSIVLVHNHPSGSPTPSKEDYAMTARFVEASGAIGIPLMDHIILGDGMYRSLLEEGFDMKYKADKNDALNDALHEEIDIFKYVALLPQEQKNYVQNELRKCGIIGQSLDSAMDSKLCDLDEVLDLQKFATCFENEGRWPNNIIQKLRKAEMDGDDKSFDQFTPNEVFEMLADQEGLHAGNIKRLVRDIYNLDLDVVSQNCKAEDYAFPETTLWDFLCKHKQIDDIVLTDTNGHLYSPPAPLPMMLKRSYTDEEMWMLDLKIDNHDLVSNRLTLNTECNRDRTLFILEGKEALSQYETETWRSHAINFQRMGFQERSEFVGKDLSKINQKMSAYEATEAYNPDQLKEIYKGLEDGIDVASFAKPEISDVEMEKRRLRCRLHRKLDAPSDPALGR